MTHIAATLFFALVLMGAVALIRFTVREYWQEILSALRGEIPMRSTSRPWSPRGRPSARPRAVVVRAAPLQQRAAS